jgi:deoxycytidylate deaminase
MIKPKNPTELAESILKRSVCAVQVGAVIEDEYGIQSWGWNSPGSGFGMHAEEHAIRRGNRQRMHGSVIYVAAVRKKSGRVVFAKPCVSCQRLIDNLSMTVRYRDKDGEWHA